MHRLRTWLPLSAVLAAMVAFLLLGSLAQPGGRPRLSPTVSTNLGSTLVASITDGDTLRLADHRRVRLAQIDAPELAECYGNQASHALEQLLPIGTQVDLRSDRSLDLRDRFGRWLLYLLKGRENVNLRLVELGAAAPYFYRGERGRYAGKLMDAARRAKAARRGLWRACPGTRLDPTHALRTRP